MGGAIVSKLDIIHHCAAYGLATEDSRDGPRGGQRFSTSHRELKSSSCGMSETGHSLVRRETGKE